MKSVETFTADIYISFEYQEPGKNYSSQVPLSAVEDKLKSIVDDVGLCVSMTPTKFLFTGGSEQGAKITLIHYPRFPTNNAAITSLALGIAKDLKALCKQERVSIVCSDETYMLEEGE